MLRQLRQTDSINGCNSLSAELMFRRLQTVEYSRAERARDAESKAMGLSSKLALEEQFVFGSLVRTAGTFMVCPTLLQHVKEETEREVLLAKNLCKAKEERELAAPWRVVGRYRWKRQEGCRFWRGVQLFMLSNMFWGDRVVFLFCILFCLITCRQLGRLAKEEARLLDLGMSLNKLGLSSWGRVVQ